MRIKYSDEGREPRSHMRDPDAQTLVVVGGGSDLDKQVREAYSVALRTIADKVIYNNSLGRPTYFVPHTITTEFVPGRGTITVLLRCRPPSKEHEVAKAQEEAAPNPPTNETVVEDESGPWEKIPNPKPGGPYWQPAIPEARYFWEQLLRAERERKRFEDLYYQQKADLAVAELQGRYRPDGRKEKPTARPDGESEGFIPRYG